MYQFNDNFSKNTEQFANAAARANRLALQNAEHAFGLQLAALEENVNATFAFWNELVDVRDAESLKAVWPKGIQVARQNIERTISTQQEVLGNTIKTNEAIAQLAKGQFEQAGEQVKAEVEKATKAATKAASRK